MTPNIYRGKNEHTKSSSRSLRVVSFTEDYCQRKSCRAALPLLLGCSGCSLNGAIEEKEWWGAINFIGDEEHYAIVKHYKKYTTGTSPFSYNGETLEEKEFIYIKNARTGASKKIFESKEFVNDFFPSLQDTAICFTTGDYSGNGYVYKYNGTLITTFRGAGVMGGWTVPYTKYVTNVKGRELIEKDWAADTSVFVDSTNNACAQPWGILNKWRGSYLIVNGEKNRYYFFAQRDQWINNHQIIGTSGVEVFDSNYVLLYDFANDSIDTLYNLGSGLHSDATVNSTATLLIRNNLEIIDLTINKYKRNLHHAPDSHVIDFTCSIHHLCQATGTVYYIVYSPLK